MISFDINLEYGVPTSPSYVGFGESVIPNGLDRTNMISVPTLSTDWVVQINYIEAIVLQCLGIILQTEISFCLA